MKSSILQPTPMTLASNHDKHHAGICEKKHPRAFFPMDRTRFHCGAEFAIVGCQVNKHVNGLYVKSDRVSKAPSGQNVPIWEHESYDSCLIITKRGDWMVCTVKQSKDPYSYEGHLKLEGMGSFINPSELAVKRWQEWSATGWKPNACEC